VNPDGHAIPAIPPQSCSAVVEVGIGVVVGGVGGTTFLLELIKKNETDAIIINAATANEIRIE